MSATKKVETTKAPARKRTRSNGEGSCYFEAARGRWVGSVTVGFEDGRQVRRKVTGKTKRAVLDRLQEAQNAAAQGMTPVRRDLTVAKYLERWITDELPGSVSSLTLANYRDVARLYIVPRLGQKRIHSLTPADVSRMLRELEQGDPSATPPRKPVAPNTRRAARAVLRRALRKAQAEGLIVRNVAAIADGVHVGGPEGRTLSPEQARQLLDHIKGDRLEAAFVVALSLGLRRGELLGLSWEDLTLDTTPPRLVVRRALKRIPGVGLVLEDPKTKTSRRTVHLPAQVVPVLRDHRRRQLEERMAAGPEWVDRPLGADLVFRTPFGTPTDPDNFRHAAYRLTTGAGVGQWSPHELRHSAASLLLAQGVDMKQISELLGHSSIRVTADIYAHMQDAGKSVAADAMSNALWGGK